MREKKIRAQALTPDSIDLFRKWLSAKGRSPHTVKGYTTDLRMLLQEMPEPIVELDEIEDLGEAWLTMHRASLSPSSTRRRLTSLREFSKWAGYEGLFTEYSTPDPGRAQPHPLPEGMAGVRRMLAATGEDDRKQALLALCGMCGLRIFEALKTEYTDFDFQDREHPKLIVRGKGDVTRTVPVSAEAMKWLTMALAHSMIEGGTLVRMGDRFARQVVTNLGVAAGLSRAVASHDLRATFATAVYNKTMNQRLVQEILGHASGKTTEGYIGVAMQAMVEGVEGL